MASHLRTTEYHTIFLQPDNNQAHLYLIPASKAGTQFTYSGRMEGWVDVGALTMPRPRPLDQKCKLTVFVCNKYADLRPCQSHALLCYICSQLSVSRLTTSQLSQEYSYSVLFSIPNWWQVEGRTAHELHWSADTSHVNQCSASCHNHKQNLLQHLWSHHFIHVYCLTIWRPLLSYGYSYKASCTRPG